MRPTPHLLCRQHEGSAVVSAAHRPSTPAEALTKEADLHHAWRQGFLTSRDSYTRQLRELRALGQPGGGGVLVSLPTRVHGDTHRLDLRNQWQSVSGPYTDEVAARAAISGGQVVHGNNRGAWKYNTHELGGGSKHYLHCNGHKDCPVLLRTRKQPSGLYMVEVTTAVMHGSEVNCCKRKNSPLTMNMEATCASLIPRGYSPKECREYLQAVVLHSGEGSKNPEGGVQGEHEHLAPTTQPPPPPPPPFTVWLAQTGPRASQSANI